MAKKELLHEKSAVSALSKGVILGCDSDEGTIYIIRKAKQDSETYTMAIKKNKSKKIEPLIEGDYKSLIEVLSGSLDNKCYIIDYPVMF